MKRQIIMAGFFIFITFIPASTSALSFNAPTSKFGNAAYKIAAGIAGIFCANKTLKKAFNSLDLQLIQYDYCQNQPEKNQSHSNLAGYHPSSRFHLTTGETNYFETFFALAFGYATYKCFKIALT